MDEGNFLLLMEVAVCCVMDLYTNKISNFLITVGFFLWQKKYYTTPEKIECIIIYKKLFNIIFYSVLIYLFPFSICLFFIQFLFILFVFFQLIYRLHGKPQTRVCGQHVSGECEIQVAPQLLLLWY